MIDGATNADMIVINDIAIDTYPAYDEGTPKSVCIVGSMRGNEIQQLYCCSMLVRRFKQLEDDGKLLPGHSVLIIPCVNPYSMNIKNVSGR